jgi:hypothetical protein
MYIFCIGEIYSTCRCFIKRRKKYQEIKMRWDLKRWNMDNERRKLEKKHTADKKKNEETKKIYIEDERRII